MKKVMMLVAVAVIAAVAQAANVDWSLSASKSHKIYGTDGTTVFGKTDGDVAYLVLTSEIANIAEALANGSLSTATAGVIGETTAFNTYGGIATKTASSSQISAATTYDFSILLVNGDQYLAFGSQNQMTSDADTVREGVFSYSEYEVVKASSGWQTAGGGNVPEPTSGLLLLVGGAMLALRRKQK